MKNNKLNYRFQAAQVLIREAGIFALEWFRNRERLKLEKKGAHDWVTKADREVELLIKKRLELLFPDDGFFGEESGIVNQKNSLFTN